MTNPTMTSAGWYPDPGRRHELRYWDGKEWTPHVSDRGLTATDPALRPPGPTDAPTTAPPATPPNQPDDMSSVNAMPREFSDKLFGVFSKFASHKGFYLAPNIPTRKLFEARTAAAVPETEQEVIALIDCSSFGNANHSFMFGRNGIYYHHKTETRNWSYPEFAQHDFALDGSHLEFDDNSYLLVAGAVSGDMVEAILHSVKTEVLASKPELLADDDRAWYEEFRRLSERLEKGQWTVVALEVGPPSVGGLQKLGGMAVGGIIGGVTGNPNALNAAVLHTSVAAGRPEQPGLQVPESCNICDMRPGVNELIVSGTLPKNDVGSLFGSILGVPGSDERKVSMAFKVCDLCRLHKRLATRGIEILDYAKAHEKHQELKDGDAPKRHKVWSLKLGFINDRTAAEFVSLNHDANARYQDPSGSRSAQRQAPSTSDTGLQPPADWYADPQKVARLRYWDGAQWTDNTAP